MDIHAPKGTAPWARAMRAELASLWQDASCNLHRFRNYLRVFAEHNGAQYFADACGAPFPSLWAFCTAKSPQGIGYEQELLETFLTDIHQIALPPPAPVEAPAAPTTGRPPGYGALPAKVREAMQAHRKKGITASELATKLGEPRKQVWATLERLVKQGRATKKGATYIARKEAA
jgi:hypothetical protein